MAATLVGRRASNAATQGRAEDNLVRAVDAFVEGLDLGKLGFGRVAPLEKGRPSYHPATLLKIYIYGYLNRVPSSRRLERECQRNIELIWLTGQLAPDFKTIADFRKDNGKAIREVCRTFVALCRELDLLSEDLLHASSDVKNPRRALFGQPQPQDAAGIPPSDCGVTARPHRSCHV